MESLTKYILEAFALIAKTIDIMFLRWDLARAILNIIPQWIAILTPLFGYAILFNDSILTQISFDKLTESEVGPSIDQVQMTYFGLIFISIARVIYSVFCNPIVRRHVNASYYFKDELSHMSKEAVLFVAQSTLESMRDKGAHEYSWDMPDQKAKVAEEIYSALNRRGVRSRYVCLALACSGLMLLFIPSFNLFLRVMNAVI